MNRETWSRAHMDWVNHSALLRSLRPRQLGESIATLKLWYLIAGLAGEPQKPDYRPAETVTLTYNELEDWSGTSRAMIRPALDRLVDLVKIRRGAGHRPNQYRVFPFVDGKQWKKIPTGRLLHKRSHVGRNTLERFDARSRASLSALKVLSVLLAWCQPETNEALVAYSVIQSRTGLSRTDISRGSSMLIELGLISVRSPRDGTDWWTYTEAEARTNRYLIHGLGKGRRRDHHTGEDEPTASE